MTDDNGYENHGAFVFKPPKEDDGKMRYSSVGKAFNLDDIPMTEEHPLASLFTGRQKWLEDNKNVVEILHKGLASLTEEQRQAIDVVFFQKHTHREAGLIIGVHHKAVQNRVIRGIERLKRYFDGDGSHMDKGEG